MRPSQIAAILRLDETDEVIAGKAPVVARAAENVPAPPRRDIDRTKKRTERLAEYLGQTPVQVN